MKRYRIEWADCPLPALTGKVFSPEAEPFCRLPFAAIDCYAWGGEYRPEARAYVGCDETGLRVLLCAREATVSAQATEFGGEVWKDSCLEFFLRPFGDDPRYLNIEVNAAGVALLAVGAGREGRVPLERLPEGMDIRASKHMGEWWAVAYTVPFRLIEALFSRPFGPGASFYGNFYKCDESIHPHFASWNPIDAPQPDFHRPECFGELVARGRDSEEYFDVCDGRGNPTGEIVARNVAHRDGVRHRTAHVWVARKYGGRWQALLQKRSANKDSFPGKYDTSSAGHIRAGDEPLASALRELEEELGIRASAEQLRFAGTFDIRYEKEFHGHIFRDNELAFVYVYLEPVDIEALTLQAEEVERADWFDVETTWAELSARRDLYCVPTEGMAVLREYLAGLPA